MDFVNFYTNNDSLLGVSLLNYKVELIRPTPSLKLEMKHRQVIPRVHNEFYIQLLVEPVAASGKKPTAPGPLTRW